MTVLPAPVRPRGDAGSDVPTVGMEEEFLLLRPRGELACLAPEVLAGVAAGTGAHAEFSRCQVEVATGICAGPADAGAELSLARRTLSRAAAVLGARLVASGTPPFEAPGPDVLTDDPRYRALVALAPEATGEEATCAGQVHVAVASRDIGAAVVARLRPWLPVLLALTGNSPLWRGRDTGWSSYRFVVQQRWPSFLPPPLCADAAAYDRRVAECIAGRASLDERGIYFWARVSPRYPTVEIRICDTCPTVADAMLLIALCRAAVMAAVADELAGRELPTATDQELVAAASAAARQGMSAAVLDPLGGGWQPARAVLPRLLDALAPALEASGDEVLVRGLLADRLGRGSGSEGQRALWRRRRTGTFVDALADLAVGG